MSARTISRLIALVMTWALGASVVAFAQTAQPAQLRVTVVDQSGGAVPGASVRVTADGVPPTSAIADERGTVTVPSLPIGAVQVHVEFAGFVPSDRTVTLRRGNNTQAMTLGIAGLEEQVVVTDTSATDDRRGNAMSTTLDEADIAELSDDPDEMQAQLEAMTGGAGAVFQVNGFRGGRLPNRDEIRQIRFRTNSFSADNHDAGRVQVEIITRAGLTTWSGNANLGLRSDVLNARNAFARTQTPEQFRRFTMGVRGPVVKSRSSLRVNVDGNRSFDSGTIVALTPAGSVLDQVRRPFDQTNVTVGFDQTLSPNSTLRLEYRNSQNDRRNLGVGDFSLMERAYSRTGNEQQIRASVQTVVRRANLNEFRLQLNDSDAVSQSVSDAVSVVVIDAFSSGGAGISSRNRTKTLNLADNFDFNVGRRHAMRVGALLDAGSYRNIDARNAAGTFTFSGLDAFRAGLPNTFTQRLGQVDTAFTQYQLGFYWQDDFRLNRQLSMSVGVRQEMQNHVDAALNLMPRLGFTWNMPRSKTIVRGGYGIFHDWYDSNLYDQTLRVDGVSQRDLLILNPGYPDPAAGASSIVLPGGRVQAAPGLSLPYVHQASIGIEHPFTQTLNVQASYQFMRGRNQLRAININAPDAFGIRPESGIGTVTQIESTGRSMSDRLSVNLNYRVPARRIFMNVGYTLANMKNMGDGALSLPANSFDPNAEWGPAAQDVRHRLNAMVNIPLPAGLRASINTSASSAAPYTITTGRDDNGDGVSNDRPAGVGRNSARGSGRFEVNTRVSRGVSFGGARGGQTGGDRGGQAAIPEGPGGAPPLALAGGQQIGIGGPGPGGGGPGPGGGGGGGVGPGGNGANQRYSVEFYAQGFNLLNRTNFGTYSGNLLSPFFGRPTSSSQARRLELGLQFRF